MEEPPTKNHVLTIYDEPSEEQVCSQEEHCDSRVSDSYSDTLCGKLLVEQSDSLQFTTDASQSDMMSMDCKGIDSCNHGSPEGTEEVKESSVVTTNIQLENATARGNVSPNTTPDIALCVTMYGTSGNMFRRRSEKAKPSRLAFGHDCYPLTVEHPGTETTNTLSGEDGLDTDSAEEHAIGDESAKGTRRAFAHVNLMGVAHGEEMTWCPVNSKLVVFDPWTPRDNVHRAYYSHLDWKVEAADTSVVREEVGNLDSAHEPRLILKAMPVGGGTLGAVLSLCNKEDPSLWTKPQMTGHDKANESWYATPPKDSVGTEVYTEKYVVTTCLKPESSSDCPVWETDGSGAGWRMNLSGGHPTMPPVNEGRVKCTAESVKEVGAATMGVGVLPFHKKDLQDLATWTVLMSFLSLESDQVRIAPSNRAKPVSAEKSS